MRYVTGISEYAASNGRQDLSFRRKALDVLIAAALSNCPKRSRARQM